MAPRTRARRAARSARSSSEGLIPLSSNTERRRCHGDQEAGGTPRLRPGLTARAGSGDGGEPMPTPLAARLERIARRWTARLTHYGRKTGKPYVVTIWFVVDGET